MSWVSSRAAVVMLAPLTGAAETSLAPAVVPTIAVTVPANTGLTVAVAPKRGDDVEAVMLAVAAAATLTVAETDFEVSSREVAVMVAVPAAAGAVQAPVFASMVPAVAVQVRAFVAPPVAVAVKVVWVLTVRVGATGLTGLRTTVCGVTRTDASAESPAALVV